MTYCFALSRHSEICSNKDKAINYEVKRESSDFFLNPEFCSSYDAIQEQLASRQQADTEQSEGQGTPHTPIGRQRHMRIWEVSDLLQEPGSRRSIAPLR